MTMSNPQTTLSAFSNLDQIQMSIRHCLPLILLLLASLALVLYTTDGDSDADLRFRGCVKRCETTGCAEGRCFRDCVINRLVEKFRCQRDCRSYCKQKELLQPRKYYGKWPFRRAILDGKQSFASVVMSALIFAMHIRGWSNLWIFLYHKMPLVRDKNQAFYNYATLWHIYGFLSLNSWVWTAVFHVQDITLIEKLNCISALILLAYSLALAMIRSLQVHKLTDILVVAAPSIAFVITHILYLNVDKSYHGWNMKVCLVMVVAEVTIWGIWAKVTQQYVRWKIWMGFVGAGFAMLLEIYDFPGYKGLVDAHFLRYASIVPLTLIWWKFVVDDAECVTILELARKIDFEAWVRPPEPEIVMINSFRKKKGKHKKGK